MASNTNLWSDREHALDYLAVADEIPHRTEGEGGCSITCPTGSSASSTSAPGTGGCWPSS